MPRGVPEALLVASGLLMALAVLGTCEVAFLGSGELGHVNSCFRLRIGDAGAASFIAHQIFLEHRSSPRKLLLTLQDPPGASSLGNPSVIAQMHQPHPTPRGALHGAQSSSAHTSHSLSCIFVGVI